VSARGVFRLLAILAVAILAPPEGAGAYVYWADGDPAGSLGRAELSGAPAPGDQWLPGLAQGCGVAVDGSHVYWTTRDGTIGRANLDGSGVEKSFIVLPGGWACGIAVGSGHLYWASNSSGKLGRANLDGSNVQPSWMSPGMGHGCGIAVDAARVYWATDSGVYSMPIGAGPTTTISTATGDNCGVAVNAVHVYWASGEGYIERDLITGGPATTIVKAPLSPCGVALDSRYLYWGTASSDTIGRSNLDGSGVEKRFVEGARHPCGVAVDSLGLASDAGQTTASPPRPSNVFRLGRVSKDRQRGTARLEVLLPGPGTVVLVGAKVREQRVVESISPSAGEGSAAMVPIEVAVRPRYRTRKTLRTYGVAIAPLAVTYTPLLGVARTRYTQVWLALHRGKSRRSRSHGAVDGR
jgi:hypothetical protein